MSIVLSVYSQSAYKEFVLPAIHNTETTLVIDRKTFNLQDDVRLNLEEVDRVWSFLPGEGYRLRGDPGTEGGWQLKHQANYRLESTHGELLSMIAQRKNTSFVNYEKYDLASAGQITVGRDPSSVVFYSYEYAEHQYISRQHALLRPIGDSVVLEDTGKNGVFVNDVRVQGYRRLEFGDRIHIWGMDMVIFGHVLAVRQGTGVKVDEKRLGRWKENYGPVDGPAHREEKEIYHRSPRGMETLDTEPVEIEAPPAPKEQGSVPLIMAVGPALTMAIPMVVGSGASIMAARASGTSASTFMYTGLISVVCSSLIGAGWTLYNIRYGRKKARQEEACRIEAYEEYLVKCTGEIEKKYNYNIQVLNKMYLSAGECVSERMVSRNNIWIRNSSHPDFLFHRLGLGDMPFQAEIRIPKERFTLARDSLADRPGEIRERYKTLRQVPICVDMRNEHLIGIVGGEEKLGAYPVVYALAAQIASQNCYTDVKMGFVFREEQGDSLRRWEFARWLPHTWSQDKKARYVAENREEARDVFYELTKILRSRSEEQPAYGGKALDCKPHYVLFVEDMSFLEGELIEKYIFGQERPLGLSVVLLAENHWGLPNACECILQNDKVFSGKVNVKTGERTEIAFDGVDREMLALMARRMSNLEVGEAETGGDIPDAVTFFGLYGISRPEELHVEERWKKNRTYESMKAPVGRKAGGLPCYLDAHEKYHGPHGLVAGTTGSGKSETLQTYMLSLAIHFSPEDVGFFIIDYKGGGMGSLFDGLPHILGQISNLSGNQVRRAMVSIKSENRRRQRVFHENGVNNINAYTRLYKNGEVSVPVPHLFIVIDEFAELKREEGEFMKELVSVAQVGRSLGVHLILATQKPAGTVDDNIWSNSKFRLCLRVQGRQDSMDMLHKPDAAYLAQAGRCYLQVGNDELYELFQSGWSGAEYDEGEGESRQELATMLSNTGKPALVGGYARRKKNGESGKSSEGKKKTQLDAVVEYLAEAARREGYLRPQPLWLPVLPEKLPLDGLKAGRDYLCGEGWPEHPGKWELKALAGLCDDPANQAQMPLVLDFAEDGHHAVCGISMSGKSTFLQTVAYDLIHRYSPEYLNLYLIDFSSRMLGVFEGEAHVGGVLYESDLDTVGKFFHMAECMVRERKRLFRGGNYGEYVATHGTACPAVLIMIDNIAAFREKTEYQYDNTLVRLLRECAPYGIYILVSGAGFNTSEITSRMRDHIHRTICLEMADRFAYGDCLNTMQLSVIPEPGIHGRGLALVEGLPLEFQAAMPLAAEGYGKNEEIRRECGRLNRCWKGQPARQIPKIPQKPMWEEFAGLDEVRELAADDRNLPIGYDMETGGIYSVDLSQAYCYLISGKRRTGKTNLLKVMMLSAKMRGGNLAAVEFGTQKLESAAGAAGALYIHTYEEYLAFMPGLASLFQERNCIKKECMKMGMEEAEIYGRLCQEPAYYVFIGDLIRYVLEVHGERGREDNLWGAMSNLLEKGFLHNIYFIACMDQDQRQEIVGKEVYEKFIRAKNGIHLGGNVAAQRLFDFNSMPYAEQSAVEKAGIGAVPPSGSGIYHRVAIPLVKGRFAV